MSYLCFKEILLCSLSVLGAVHKRRPQSGGRRGLNQCGHFADNGGRGLIFRNSVRTSLWMTSCHSNTKRRSVCMYFDPEKVEGACGEPWKTRKRG